MKKIIIVAVAENGCIGADNRLPWHFSEDLRMFKHETTGHAIIMGRTTYESIGKPLPDRLNIVLTRSPHASDHASLIFAGSLDEAFQHAASRQKAFVVGGAEVYQQALPLVDELWITEVPGPYQGDVHFPQYPVGADWLEYQRQNGQEVTFVRYRRP
jgi:dihydrofolate reductase